MIGTTLECAPLQGVTTYTFRTLHSSFFGGVDRYYTPFISPTQNHRFTSRELADIDPENNRGLTLVPQLIGHCADDFLWAAGELAAMGYTEVDLNLGCPSGTVTRKKKGSGLLADIPLLTDFLTGIFMSSPVKISIKTRLGLKSADEAAVLIDLFNRYPVSSLIVHPRVGVQLYKGETDMAAFARILEKSRAPVVMDGDIFSKASAESFTVSYPGAAGIMLGRGLVANPALASEIRGGNALTADALREFHSVFFRANQRRIGCDKPLLLHMKEFWGYWGENFEACDRQLKAIFKATDSNSYLAAVNTVFDTCKFTGGGKK